MNTSTKAGRVSLSLGPLEALRQQVKLLGPMRVKVGVLSRTDARKEGTINNATLGAIHEFGSIEAGIPARSWLRMPLIQHLPEAIKVLGADHWRELVEKQGLVGALKELGFLGEMVVDDAFATGGFGQWARLKRATIRRKKSAAILIDHGELRQAVTSEVEKGRA